MAAARTFDEGPAVLDAGLADDHRATLATLAARLADRTSRDALRVELGRALTSLPMRGGSPRARALFTSGDPVAEAAPRRGHRASAALRDHLRRMAWAAEGGTP